MISLKDEDIKISVMLIQDAMQFYIQKIVHSGDKKLPELFFKTEILLKSKLRGY